MNYVISQTAAPKRPLIINMDETGIPLFLGDARGNIWHPGKRACQQKPLLRQHATRQQMRSQITHVALICDDQQLQCHMPQILVGDHVSLPAKVLADLQLRDDGNLFVLRLKSRWTDAALMLHIVKCLNWTLGPLMDDIDPVLLLDCCPAHLHPDVQKVIKKAKMKICFVPAKMTGLLQPLDAHVFAPYKRQLRQNIYRRRLAGGGGDLAKLDFWRVVIEHVETFMTSRSWAHAFAATGWTQTQQAINDYLLRQLCLSEAPTIPAARPSAEDLAKVLPKHRSQDPQKWLLENPTVKECLGHRIACTTLSDNGIETCVEEQQNLEPASPTEIWRTGLGRTRGRKGGSSSDHGRMSQRDIRARSETADAALGNATDDEPIARRTRSRTTGAASSSGPSKTSSGLGAGHTQLQKARLLASVVGTTEGNSLVDTRMRAGSGV